MTCGQLILLLLLLLIALAAVGGGAYWVMTNTDLTGGPALPTAFKVNTVAPPTRTSGPVVLPATWTLTPSATSTETPTSTLTPTETETLLPASGTTTATP